MAANIRKRGKSESPRCHLSILPRLSVCAFIRPRGISSRHPVVLQQLHSTSPSPEVMLPCHLISPEWKRSLRLTQLLFTEEVTNGGFFIPGAASCKLILYQTTNTCIPLLMPANQREAGRWGGTGCWEMPSRRLRRSLNILCRQVFLTHWLGCRCCCKTNKQIFQVECEISISYTGHWMELSCIEEIRLVQTFSGAELNWRQKYFNWLNKKTQLWDVM